MFLSNQKIATLNTEGWVQILDIQRHDLETIARQLGNIKPHSNGALIYSVKPKARENATFNTLSHRYEMGNFPLHTDTAFWITPTRYVILYSEMESPCSTLILKASNIFKLLNASELKRLKNAIYLVKTLSTGFYTSPFFRRAGVVGFKFDNLCMQPYNKDAKSVNGKLVELIQEIAPIRITWKREKLLIFDNWKVLHGREQVIQEDRELKRIYIS